MNLNGWEQLLFVCAATAVLAPPLGRYLAATFRDDAASAPGDRIFAPVERLVYRALRVDPKSSMTWQVYAIAVLVFGLLSSVLLYVILRLQGVLPLNPTHAPDMSPTLSFNTAISFITGTNWQAYEGETQASYLADMAGLVVAQFAPTAAACTGWAARTRSRTRPASLISLTCCWSSCCRSRSSSCSAGSSAGRGRRSRSSR
jgi:K+-transporting ATPase ATPase A chain